MKPDFMYSVPASATKWEVSIQWLEDNFGPSGDRWEYYRTRFWFRSEEDKLVFVLMFV